MASVRNLLKKRRSLTIAGVLAVGSIGLLGWVRTVHREPTVPSFKVQPAEFLDVVQFRGEMKALRSITISAPPDVGTLQIVKLVADGSVVKQGDVVVEFDPSKTKSELATVTSQLKSAEAETDQARAQGRLTEEEDTTAIMKARYDVEVARLDAGKEEIVSHIEGAEARLKVADAEQSLRQAEEKLKSDRAKTEAAINEHRNASGKARFDEQRAAHALASMVLNAPADGNISLVSVWHDSSEGPFKPGENAWPGSPIAELPDPSSMRIVAHVDETERGRLSVSQPVTVTMDAIPDRQFSGKIEHIGTIATSDFSAGWPIPRNFTLEIALDQNDPRLRPGMTVQIAVIVDRVANAISIPVQATFMNSGQSVAYVWNGSAFEERAIRIQRRSRDRALIESGLKPGDTVALKDPTLKQ